MNIHMFFVEKKKNIFLICLLSGIILTEKFHAMVSILKLIHSSNKRGYQDNIFLISEILHENICCGYSVEVPTEALLLLMSTTTLVFI